jgi:hypothetical protein
MEMTEENWTLTSLLPAGWEQKAYELRSGCLGETASIVECYCVQVTLVKLRDAPKGNTTGTVVVQTFVDEQLLKGGA